MAVLLSFHSSKHFHLPSLKPNSFEISTIRLYRQFLFPITVNCLPPYQSPTFTDVLTPVLLFFFISIPVSILSDSKIYLDDPINTEPSLFLKVGFFQHPTSGTSLVYSYTINLINTSNLTLSQNSSI